MWSELSENYRLQLNSMVQFFLRRKWNTQRCLQLFKRVSPNTHVNTYISQKNILCIQKQSSDTHCVQQTGVNMYFTGHIIRVRIRASVNHSDQHCGWQSRLQTRWSSALQLTAEPLKWNSITTPSPATIHQHSALCACTSAWVCVCKDRLC